MIIDKSFKQVFKKNVFEAFGESAFKIGDQEFCEHHAKHLRTAIILLTTENEGIFSEKDVPLIRVLQLMIDAFKCAYLTGKSSLEDELIEKLERYSDNPYHACLKLYKAISQTTFALIEDCHSDIDRDQLWEATSILKSLSEVFNIEEPKEKGVENGK